ncbi:MAG: HXXEE domain-containing protein [Candidatus Cloacimonetes bacterium]|nr:HXXEE domain-containing protein [Candidatus Cloacimonadota bacterium]
METIIQAWLSIWLYVMTAIAAGLGIKIYRNRKAWTKLSIFCTLAIIVLVLHVLEEWVLPGGLHYSYNLSHGSSYLSRYPMNRLTDMITNFGAVIIGCIVLHFWGWKKSAAIAIMLFSLFEVVIHVTIGIADMKTFSSYGMNTLYSPGLATSLFGFLPVAIGIGIELFKGKGNRPKFRQWLMAIAAIGVLGFLLINLPEQLLSDENTPYEFTDRGYYERFGEQFEEDNGYDYFEQQK